MKADTFIRLIDYGCVSDRVEFGYKSNSKDNINTEKRNQSK